MIAKIVGALRQVKRVTETVFARARKPALVRSAECIPPVFQKWQVDFMQGEQGEVEAQSIFKPVIAGTARFGGAKEPRRAAWPSAAATCIGPVSLVIIKSPKRIHSIISGREVAPHRFRQRSGAARPRLRRAGGSAAADDGKMHGRKLFDEKGNESGKCCAGQRLFSSAPGWSSRINCGLRIADCGRENHLSLTCAAISGCSGSH